MASSAASTSETATRGSGRIRHVLSALVQNQPGVLAHVSGMFASRGFNIDSLAVGETDDDRTCRGSPWSSSATTGCFEQIRKQLEKIVTVVKVDDISRRDYVERDLMLLKVKATREQRGEIQALVEIFRGRVVDVGPEQMMIEVSGKESKLEAFIEAVRPYGIGELARTGRIALVRDSHVSRADLDEAEEEGAVVGHSSL